MLFRDAFRVSTHSQDSSRDPRPSVDSPLKILADASQCWPLLPPPTSSSPPPRICPASHRRSTTSVNNWRFFDDAPVVNDVVDSARIDQLIVTDSLAIVSSGRSPSGRGLQRKVRFNCFNAGRVRLLLLLSFFFLSPLAFLLFVSLVLHVLCTIAHNAAITNKTNEQTNEKHNIFAPFLCAEHLLFPSLNVLMRQKLTKDIRKNEEIHSQLQPSFIYYRTLSRNIGNFLFNN